MHSALSERKRGSSLFFYGRRVEEVFSSERVSRKRSGDMEKENTNSKIEEAVQQQEKHWCQNQDRCGG